MKEKIKHLVVGYGEVGKAIHKILGEAFVVDIKEKCTWDGKKIDVTHICIPFSKNFNAIVKMYMKYSELVIVHSSVPVGTCDRLGVVHSPIRGVHPNLEQGVRTFVKYFGGKGCKKATQIFAEFGIKGLLVKDARTTEALKLWDTTQYGKLIILEKEIYKWCKKHKIDFDTIYTMANKDYNEGYVKLGRPEVVRPYLKHMEGKIGGHCVGNNAKLLGIKL